MPDSGVDGGGCLLAMPTATGTPLVPILAAPPACELPTCGGEIPAGVYTYDAVCADDPFAAANTTCPGTGADGGNLLAGQIVFDGCGTMRRQVHLVLGSTVSFPSPCTLACGTVQTSVRMYVPNATCAVANGACRCPINYMTTVTEEGPYTLDGGVLSFFSRADGGARRFDYCVSGNRLTMRELNVSVTELGTVRLTR